MTRKASGTGRAEACANIALAKYWGKSERGDNLTAVPSLSVTLDALRTRTEVTFDDSLDADQLIVGGQQTTGRPLERVSEHLDRFRALASEQRRARVTSVNNFPTAAGLASSASAFAALAVATNAALGTNLTPAALSSQARRSSASAGRSLFGGFAELLADADSATPLFDETHWDVVMLVAVIASGPKDVASTGGMIHTKETSPFYRAWEVSAPSSFERVKTGVRERDFTTTVEAMEHSTRMMHATMLTSEPPVLYLKGTTIDLMHEVARARAEGLSVGYTMDAGPNVKVLAPEGSMTDAHALLERHPGVQRIIVCRPGPGASELFGAGSLESAARLDGRSLGEFKPGGPAP